MIRVSLALLTCLLAVPCLVVGVVVAADAHAAAPMPHHAVPDAFIETSRSDTLDRHGVLDVRLAVDWARLRGVLQEDVLETVQRGFMDDLDDVVSVRLWAEVPNWPRFRWVREAGHKPGDWLPLVEFLEPAVPVPKRESERSPMPSPPPPPSTTLAGQPHTGQPAGALSGVTVYLSPGHGWTWNQVLGRWATQRGNTHDIVEDFVNAEAATHYLLPMLHNAGATVVGVRELDTQENGRVVDDASGKPYYAETGTWQKGSDKGFKATGTLANGVNPFALGGYRAAKAVSSKATGGKSTAIAVYRPFNGRSGRYGVYVGYTEGSNRVPDAHYEIRHADGVTHVRIDQRKHGQTWHWLGHYRFALGANADKAAVILHNDTLGDATGKYVIADVVRFGGGYGIISRGTGASKAKSKTTTRPRWESCARYHTQYAGAPKTVYDSASTGTDGTDDVSSRSRFSAWHHEGKDEAIYLSWHSNAPDPARGTSTYVYGPGKPWSGAPFTGVKGSMEFAKLIQSNLVKDIRATFDPKWKDRGVRTAWFGEVNPKHNPEMPAALVECAFHSTKADADFMRQPRWRHLAARALYKSVVGYFAAKWKKKLTLVPEPPTSLRATVNASTGKVTVSWKPGPTGGVNGDAATGYQVQVSTDGFGYPDVKMTNKTSLEFGPVALGKPTFVRVVGFNKGGLSLPSAVVGVVRGCKDSVALVVQGFTRLSAKQLPVDDLSAWSLKKVQRLRQDVMNTYDYMRWHLAALANNGMSADGAERDAFSSMDLSTYRFIDWAAGEQSTADVVWTKADRDKLGGWLNGGGGRAVLANGSEIAWAVDKHGGKDGGDWLKTWFGAGYGADDAGVYSVVAAAGEKHGYGGVFSDGKDSANPKGGDSGSFIDGQGAKYDVDFPDVLKLSGAKALLEYDGGKGVAASVYGVGGIKTALVGFPLETIRNVESQTKLMKLFATRLGVPMAGFVCGSPGADSGSSSGSDAGSVADAGTVPAADAGSVPQADAGGSVPTPDGFSPDVGGGADSGASDVGSSLAPAGDDDGCGCDIRGRQDVSGGSVALVLLLLGGLLAIRFKATRHGIAGVP